MRTASWGHQPLMHILERGLPRVQERQPLLTRRDLVALCLRVADGRASLTATDRRADDSWKRLVVIPVRGGDIGTGFRSSGRDSWAAARLAPTAVPWAVKGHSLVHRRASVTRVGTK
jgi:hypothetical protein